MTYHCPINPTVARLARAGVMLLALSSASQAADPMVPTTTRPMELLRQQAQEPGLRLGVFDVHLRLSAGVIYDDNIALSATDRQSDVISTIGAEVLAVADRQVDGEGVLLSLGYRPSVNLFAEHTSNNALNHHVKLNAQWANAKLALGVSQTFEQTTAGVVEVGQRLQQRFYLTELMATYAVSEKTSLEVGPRLTISETEGLLGNREWAVDGFLNWEATPKVEVGAGSSFGYVEIEQNPSERYERALLRAIYTPTPKLNATVTAGGEWRQYDSGQTSTFGPVFGLSGAYRPWDGTTLTLEGHRREQPSVVLSGQSFTATGFSGEIHQRVLDMYFISMAGGYEHRSYRATQPGSTGSRRDDYARLRASVGANFLHRWTVTVFYEYQRNQSDMDTHTFNNNQVGFDTTWGF
jgi:hypothetical protein